MCAVYLRSTRVANAQRCRAPWAGGRALQVGGGEVHADDKADFNKTSVLEVLERAAAFCVVRMREVRAVAACACEYMPWITHHRRMGVAAIARCCCCCVGVGAPHNASPRRLMEVGVAMRRGPHYK